MRSKTKTGQGARIFLLVPPPLCNTQHAEGWHILCQAHLHSVGDILNPDSVAALPPPSVLQAFFPHAVSPRVSTPFLTLAKGKLTLT